MAVTSYSRGGPLPAAPAPAPAAPARPEWRPPHDPGPDHPGPGPGPLLADRASLSVRRKRFADLEGSSQLTTDFTTNSATGHLPPPVAVESRPRAGPGPGGGPGPGPAAAGWDAATRAAEQLEEIELMRAQQQAAVLREREQVPSVCERENEGERAGSFREREREIDR